MRNPDESIPANESLYRKLKRIWVVKGAVDPHGVRIPQCSFDRESYVDDPHNLLSTIFEGVASITPGNLPGPIPSPVEGAPQFVFSAVDDPIPEDLVLGAPENLAHCEVHFQREGEELKPNINNKKVKLAAARALAKKLILDICP